MGWGLNEAGRESIRGAVRAGSDGEATRKKIDEVLKPEGEWDHEKNAIFAEELRKSEYTRTADHLTRRNAG